MKRNPITVRFKRCKTLTERVENYVPMQNEPLVEKDTMRWKIGDGIHRYKDLPYQPGTLPTYSFKI